MKRICIVQIITSLVFFLSVVACQSNREADGTNTKQKPNIIYILADDLGYGDLGCYGQTEIKTPNLDNMASAGMRFTQHYAGSTVCAPSRCSLMTGLHTGHSKVRGNARVPLGEDDTTIASILNESGYKTGLIGKWGLGDNGTTGAPNLQGFDYFFGYLSQIRAHNFYPDYLWRNTEKVPLDNEIILADKGYAKGKGSASRVKKEYSHDLFTSDALNFIQESADSSFFLYLAYTIPHANNEHWILDEHGMEVPDYGIYKDKDWPEAQKGLAAMISRMDGDIGKIKNKLKELGIDKNTLIIFSSDNGPHSEGMNDPEFFESNGKLRGQKRDLYEGGIRVPMIANWPGTISPGQVSNHQSAFWDFLPTACEIADINPPENIDGISFLPELLGEQQTQHDNLYWEFHEQGGKQALQKGNWKLVVRNVVNDLEPVTELYKLSDDLSEENNLAGENPEMVKQLSDIMKKERVPSKEFPFTD